jgi:hypothetical protein
MDKGTADPCGMTTKKGKYKNNGARTKAKGATAFAVARIVLTGFCSS